MWEYLLFNCKIFIHHGCIHCTANLRWFNKTQSKLVSVQTDCPCWIMRCSSRWSLVCLRMPTFLRSWVIIDNDNVAFADNRVFDERWCFCPQAGHTVRQLLRVAKKTVPPVEWKRTPVVFRATAGLRLLPLAKAHALLEEVQRTLEKMLLLQHERRSLFTVVFLSPGTRRLRWISVLRACW